MAPRIASDRLNGHHGRIVSHAPGRVRVRLHPDHRQPATFEQIEQKLNGHAAIAGVTTSLQTGSVLLHYDRTALTGDDVVDLLHDVGIVVEDLAGAEEIPDDLGLGVAAHSSTATGVLDALTDLDRRLSRLTGGRLDVKLLMPLCLGALAVRQIATTGLGLAEVPGYVLLWYTFDSFYKLHQRKTATTLEGAPADATEGVPSEDASA